MFVFSGFQVPPAELEALLLSHDEIAGKNGRSVLEFQS